MKYLSTLALLFCYLANIIHADCNQAELAENPTFQERGGKGPYLSLIGGINFFNPDYHPGYYLGSALGYKFGNNFKIECEISYQRIERGYSYSRFGRRRQKADGHIRSWSYMANFLYNFDLNFPINPYIGIGLGYSRNHFCRYDTFNLFVHEEVDENWIFEELMCTRKKQTEPLRFDEFCTHGVKGRIKREFDEGAFTWQIIAGISYSFCHNLKLGLEYRSFNFEDKCYFHRVGLVLTRSF